MERKLESLEKETEKLYKENLEINLASNSLNSQEIKKFLCSGCVLRFKELMELSFERF